MGVTFLQIVLTANASALVTLTVSYWVVKRMWLPAMREEVDREFDEKLQVAVSTLSEEVRESVRQGVLQAVTEIPSAETLKGTTQTMAKAGVEIMGMGLDVMRGKKR